MITSVKVLSRMEAVDVVANVLHTTDPITPFALISINDIDDGLLVNESRSNKLTVRGIKGILSLTFSDLTQKDYDECIKYQKNVTLMSHQQAKLIVEFIKRMHEDKDEMILTVHCKAGISRSGAIGTFANDYAKLDYNTFMKENYTIYPNTYILSKLYEIADMTPRQIERKPLDADTIALLNQFLI